MNEERKKVAKAWMKLNDTRKHIGGVFGRFIKNPSAENAHKLVCFTNKIYELNKTYQDLKHEYNSTHRDHFND